MTLKQKAYNDVVNYIWDEAIHNNREFSEKELNEMLCYSMAIHNHDKQILELKTNWINKIQVKKNTVKKYTCESTLRMAGSIKRSFDNVNRRFN